MQTVEVKIGDWIQEGFNLYKENFGLLVLASLVAVVLSVVTGGILAGPMFAGLILICLALYDGDEPKPQMGDVFKGFSYFLNAFLFFLVWIVLIAVVFAILNIIPILGQLAGVCLILAAQALLIFGLFLIVDRGMDFWPASMESINMVKSNFWPFLGLGVLSAIIGNIGSLICGIGAFLTVPIHICIMTVAYRNVFNGSQTAQGDTPQTPPPVE